MDLTKLRQRFQPSSKPCRIRCCTVGGCLSAGGPTVKAELEKTVANAELDEQVDIVGVGCMGLCSQGPRVFIFLCKPLNLERKTVWK